MKSFTQFKPQRLTRQIGLGLATLSLAACSTLGQNRYAKDDASYRPLPINASAAHLYDSIPKDKLTTASRQLVAEGVKALDARDYDKASKLFNLALKTDLNNSYLHFLNGLTYHMRGLSGEGALYALAQQGYEMAIQFDPSNTSARHYLGLLYLDRHEFAAARAQLMEAALYVKNDPDLLYDLAVASYYSKDPRTAYAALEGLRNLEKGHEFTRTLRASAIVAASAGDSAMAGDFIKRMHLAGADADEMRFTEDRVQSWNDAYGGGMVKTQFPGGNGSPTQGAFGNSFPSAPGTGGFPSSPPPSGGMQQQGFGAPSSFGLQGSQGGFFDKKMVMLDVTIISTEEDNNDTSGINLLSGLQIQFGNGTGTPAVSRQTTTTSDLVANTTTSARTVTRLIQIPAISYTLNIANASDSRSEVLARPSLVAMGGQASTFFSGTDVVGAAVSTGQGGSVQVQKEAGVKLSVTPEFMPDNLIKIKVEAERTFLTNPSSNVKFDFRLDTSKTLVSANVAMKFGETLILSGLSEHETDHTNSGVPLLRDVPLVQYLFSQRTKRDYLKSVLILITPRHPSYTNRSQEDIDAERSQMSEFDRMQAEFEEKYRIWFKPIPNTAQAIRTLEFSPLYREFHSGDLTMESWISRASHGGRLSSALSFLYY